MSIVFGTPGRRVQLVHLRTDVHAERELKSQQSLRRLEARGIDYVERVNPRATAIPEAMLAFCRRPDHISPDGKPGFELVTPAAWGCYAAHRDALAQLADTADYTIICECDTGISVPISEFCWILDEAIERIERDDAYLVNLGPDLDRMAPQEEHYYDDLFVNAWYQIPLNAYVVPNRRRDWYQARIRDSEWDSADMWLNHVFCHHRQLRLRTYRRFVDFFSGPSLIDDFVKQGNL